MYRFVPRWYTELHQPPTLPRTRPVSTATLPSSEDPSQPDKMQLPQKQDEDTLAL